tara:strand:+ start:133 stop:654 length:522 start_codon:yes stop_codon:yes gene_type:complete
MSEFNEITEDTDTECCICYEIIGKVNNCITECGHKFCFKCMAKSLQNHHTCPYCRTLIIEPKTTYDELHDLNDLFYDTDDDLYMDDLSEEDKKPACVDDIVERLEKNKITMIDLVSYFDNRYNSNTAPYSPSRCDADIYFIEAIGDTINDIFVQADNECKEQLLFEKEDSRNN